MMCMDIRLLVDIRSMSGGVDSRMSKNRVIQIPLSSNKLER